MKKKIILLGSSFFAILLLSSCAATHHGKVKNVYDHSTEIILQKNNFVVVKNVKASVSVTYIFGIGGHGKNALITEARQKMLEQADLEVKPRAVINEIFEVKGAVFPFIGQKTVTVSAQVIEFTD